MKKGVSKRAGRHSAMAVGILALMLTASQAVMAQGVKPVMGKYGCTASKYSGGSYQYTPRGSIVLADGGKYTYNGFEKPSSGSYSVDDKGNLSFKGGYLNAGQATKIDRPNKYFVVFPSNPDNRWTCGLADK